MSIRARMGISVDGFVASADGRPALLSMPDFSPAVSHGFPEFTEGWTAVVIGRIRSSLRSMLPVGPGRAFRFSSSPHDGAAARNRW